MKNVRTSESVKPIFLSSEEIENNSLALASGWRKPKLNLKGFPMRVISRNECLQFYSEIEVLDDSFCAEGECVQDLGSPLTSKWTLIGILSSCKEGKPAIYTNIFHHIFAILESIQIIYNTL